MKPDKERHFITALARGLEVLQCFKMGKRFLGNQQLSSQTGLPKSTVSRLTFTLTELGYLKYHKTLEKYSLGTAVLSLGHSYLSYLNIRQVARPMMQELSDYSRASVAIGARDRLEMVYIENCRSSATSFTIQLNIGSHLSLAETAIGRAYLCGVPEADRNRLLDQIRLRNKDNWGGILAGIEHSLLEYQEKGFCLSTGDWHNDVNAVAVPFIPEDGSDVLSFNCGGPAYQLSREVLENDIGPRLVTLTRNVTSQIFSNNFQD